MIATSFFFLVFLAFSFQQDPGQPLILSQYLPNQPQVARQLSQVRGVGNYTSYSGYFTVNSTYGSNMFFWFFPSQDNNPTAPVCVWLQGGPGGSSMFGLFTENGPFSVNADGATLSGNPYTWARHFAMIYIDNPVGTGFSFTTDKNGFCTDQTCVANNLYSLITQFFQVFPDYAKNEFYITGESYAGKYIPSFAYKIYQMNQVTPQIVNLKGIAIGDGAMSPIDQFVGYGELLYYIGMADEHEVEVIRSYEARIVEGIAEGNYLKAFLAFDEFLNGDFYPYPTYFFNITGTTNYFNFLDPVYPPNPFDQYLNLNTTRSKIHVGSVPYASGNSTVEAYLINDWMKSVAPILPPLLENYKVMIYNGQLDIILGPPLTEKFLRNIPWSGQKGYQRAHKQIWKLDSGLVAGYVRSVKKFYQVVIRFAGHLAPSDAPQASLNMIENFVFNKPFSK
jgi:vitellogenic carboxypeptidase-like protein